MRPCKLAYAWFGLLALVIQRLVTLISSQAALLAQPEASLRQAESATAAAYALMVAPPNDITLEEFTTLRERVAELTACLAHEQDALKSKTEDLHKEYERLTNETIEWQKRLSVKGSTNPSMGSSKAAGIFEKN